MAVHLTSQDVLNLVLIAIRQKLKNPQIQKGTDFRKDLKMDDQGVRALRPCVVKAFRAIGLTFDSTPDDFQKCNTPQDIANLVSKTLKPIPPQSN